MTQSDSIRSKRADANKQPASADLMTSLAAQRDVFLAFLMRRVSNRAVAEDILQEALARSLVHADQLRSGEARVAWFYQTLRNAVADHHRRNVTANKALGGFAAEVDHTQAIGTETETSPCQCVARLADQLKPEYADALRRVEVEGMAVKTFAERVGISAGNAAVRVHRARTALRQHVIASCGACAALGCADCTCVGDNHGSPPTPH